MAATNLFSATQLVRGVAKKDRAAGAGIVFFRRRVHIGSDVEYSTLDGFNASIGTSIIVANNVEVGTGYLTTESTTRFSCRLKTIEYSLRLSPISGAKHYIGSMLRF